MAWRLWRPRCSILPRAAERMALAGVGAETSTLTGGGGSSLARSAQDKVPGGASTGQGGGMIDARDYFRDLGIICVGFSVRVLSVEFITKNQYSMSDAMLKGYFIIVVIVGGVVVNRSFVIGRY